MKKFFILMLMVVATMTSCTLVDSGEAGIRFKKFSLTEQGCPKCNASKLELEIESILLKNNIMYNQGFKFPWLGRQHLDFYLPQYNIAIECQGEQHFVPVKFFGGKLGLENIQKRDLNKLNLCKKHGVKLFYYAHEQYTPDIITDPVKLLELITSNN